MTDPLPAPRLLVIADDLTGANDTGVQFARHGISTEVLLDWHVPHLRSGCEVLVVNTESRHISEPEAVHRVSHLARIGLAAGVKRYFKKTDSTLRGNIGAELEALRTTLGAHHLFFVPAFPELGRTTRGGLHFVHGVPIAESAFGRDPLNPIRHSDVRTLLEGASRRRIQVVTGDSELSELGEGIVMFDCELQTELAAIAGKLNASGRIDLLAGSAAFANAMRDHLEFTLRPRTMPALSDRILIVNGSLNERALEQIAHVPESFARRQLSPELLFGKDARSVRKLSGGASQNLLLYSVSKRAELAGYLSFARAAGWDEEQAHLQAAEAIGRAARYMIENYDFRTLIVFGGDTLTGIARACGWRSFAPLTEAAPGVTVALPTGTDLIVISKAGGFGEPDLILRILDFITRAPDRNESARSQPQKT